MLLGLVISDLNPRIQVKGMNLYRPGTISLAV
jgi:hypothetical protein